MLPCESLEPLCPFILSILPPVIASDDCDDIWAGRSLLAFTISNRSTMRRTTSATSGQPLVFTSLAILLLNWFLLTASAATPPNIVYILADDLGYGDVKCLNPISKIATPHLDRLAAGGMTFTDAHSSSSVCTPSRYNLLTGRYNWRSRRQEGVLGGFGAPLIDRERLTVPALLKQHGYTTACIGKWHLGMALKEKGDSNQPIPDNPTTRAGGGEETVLPLSAAHLTTHSHRADEGMAGQKRHR